MKLPSVAFLTWLLAYLTFLGIVAGAALYGRRQAMALYGTPEAQNEWDAWRTDAKKLDAGPAPVQRRMPKSEEPPALVLMRDYFAICLTGALLLSSVLFGTFMVLIRGAFSEASPKRPQGSINASTKRR